MKYLNNREEFLKRSISKIDEYKKYDDLYSINEDVENSGPFANDIPWGDSLLGRLINSTIRKAKIGANLVRIKGVARRLRDTFDELLGTSTAAELSEEDRKEYRRLIVFSFIDSLQKAVEEGANVGEIKNLTRAAINDIKNFEDFENKENLISQLEEFLKFLEQFKDDEGGKSEADKDKEEGEGKEGSEEGSEKGSESGKTSESLYPVMIKNLKSLGIILDAYKRVKIQSSTPVAKSSSIEPYKTKEGDTIEKIQKDVNINKKKMSLADIRTKNSKILQKYPKDNQTLPAGLALVMESSIFEAVPGTTNQPGGSQDRGNIKSGEDHLTQAFSKLKRDIEVLISSKEKGIGVDVAFINDITSKSVDTNAKNQIKSLYTEINRYLVGDKKSTIQEKDPLYKESLEIISDKNKRIIVAEKIARFSKRALQFDKEGLYGGLGDLTKPLQDFVESIKQIMRMVPSEPKKEETQKEVDTVAKKESSLFRYNNFIKLVKEAEEDKEKSDEVGAPDVMTTSQKIKDYWKKKIDIKAFVMEKTEVIKMKEKFDKLEKEKKDSIVINGMDPVLDVVKCFNRAYKIHTTQVIPSGRSGGKVSNKTFMEYTSFGGGTPANAGSGGGPYRNNAIFNQWENTVLDIMKEKKYQPIFNVGTKIKVGDELIEKAGSNLRKFMSDMLDGDELYKTGKDDKGQQAKFLDKYFGYTESDPNKISQDTTFGGEKEAEEISGNANSIKTVDLLFTKDPIKFESNDNLKKTFFSALTKDGKVYYFFIQDVVGDTAYIVYSRTFYFFEKYISQSGVSNKLEKGDLPRLNKDRLSGEGTEKASDFRLKATKKKIENLIGKDGVFKLSGGYDITHLTKHDGKSNNVNTKATLSEKPEVVNIQSCYTLYQNTKDVETTSGKTRFVLNKDISNQINNIGGFPKISSTDGITKTEMKKQ